MTSIDRSPFDHLTTDCNHGHKYWFQCKISSESGFIGRWVQQFKAFSLPIPGLFTSIQCVSSFNFLRIPTKNLYSSELFTLQYSLIVPYNTLFKFQIWLSPMSQSRYVWPRIKMFHNKWSIIMDFMFLEIKWYPSNIGYLLDQGQSDPGSLRLNNIVSRCEDWMY